MEQNLLKLFLSYSDKIEKNAFKEILHYYEYCEYEMALEGFLIEIISNNIIIDKKDLNNIIYLAKYYNLHNEAIFDYQIYNKLQKYLKIK